MTPGRALTCALIVCSFLVRPTSSLAQGDQGSLAVSIHNVDDRDFPAASVAFTIDEKGRPVNEIRPEDVRIEESGAPATQVSVRRATDTNIPLALVVTIDVSGSMEGETLAKAQMSATRLIDSLEPSDRAAVLTFGNEVRVEQNLSADRAALRNAIERLGADGSTALYDGVARSTELAAASGLTRRAIVLLSDGKESGDASSLSREASLAIAAGAGSPFYVVGVGPEIDREYLEQLAARSGGRYFEAAGAAQVPDIYASLAELLKSQFIATFRSTSPAELRERNIRITVSRAGVTAVEERAYTSLRPLGPAQSIDVRPEETAPAPSTPALPIQLAGLTIVFGLSIALLVLRRARTTAQKHGAEDVGEGDGEAQPEVIGPAGAEHWSTIRVVTGPAGAMGRTLAFRGEPITLGSAVSCGLRLVEDADVAPEHVRLWIRDGKLMLHHIARGRSTKIGGKSVVWGSLDDGDQFEVGPYLLRWRADSNGAGEDGVDDGLAVSDQASNIRPSRLGSPA